MNLTDLNTQQLKAVKTVKHPVLVFAGAGSGMTRVLTYKIWHLIKDKIYKTIFNLVNKIKITRYETNSGISSWGIKESNFQEFPGINIKKIEHSYDAMILDFSIDVGKINLMETIKKIMLERKV